MSSYGSDWGSSPAPARRRYSPAKKAQMVIGAILLIVGLWLYFSGWETVFGPDNKFAPLAILVPAVGAIVFIYGLVGRTKVSKRERASQQARRANNDLI